VKEEKPLAKKTEMEYYANFMLKHTPKLYISLSSSKKKQEDSER
jgi:hypothetical protein